MLLSNNYPNQHYFYSLLHTNIEIISIIEPTCDDCVNCVFSFWSRVDFYVHKRRTGKIHNKGNYY